MTSDNFLDQLLRRRDGIYSSDLLLAAIGYLDFFSWLGEHPADVPGVCRALGLKERPVDVMLTLFRAMGLVHRQGMLCSITDQARLYLVKNAGNDLRPYFNSLRDRPICREIIGVLRTGIPINWSNDPKTAEWAKAMDDQDFAVSFTSAMDSRGAVLAPPLARVLPCDGKSRLLDVAGGSGVYAASILMAHEQMRGAVLERAPVGGAARDAIRARELAGRLSVIEGDMFSDAWPTGFDIHLFSHVLHDWETGEVKTLLANSYRVLEPGGLLAVYDVHVNREKDGPIEAAEYSVLLMLSTRGKCYSLGEMEELLAGIGFEKMEVRMTAGFRTLITAHKPG